MYKISDTQKGEKVEFSNPPKEFFEALGVEEMRRFIIVSAKAIIAFFS